MDWENPRARDIQKPGIEADLAKLLKSLIVNESLLKVLHKGKEGSGAALYMMQCLEEKLSPLLKDGVVESIVLRQSLQQLASLCSAIFVLTGAAPAVENPTETLEQAYSAFDVFKHKVSQVGYWRDCDRKLREYNVAVKTLVPEMNGAVARLEAALSKKAGHSDGSGVDMKYILEVAHRLLVWEEALLPGAQRDLVVTVCRFRIRIGVEESPIRKNQQSSRLPHKFPSCEGCWLLAARKCPPK